jgi:hypothetical protein
MSIPKTSYTPDDPKDLPPARRRRAQRGLIPEEFQGEAQEVESYAHQTSPSFDFFLFSLLSGSILTAAILLDSPALLVLGALAAPLMSPYLGISLGTVTGSVKFFTQRLSAALVAGSLVFLTGLLGGYAARVYDLSELVFIPSFTQIHWTHILLLAVGALFTALGITQPKASPHLPSAAIAYELLIPLTAAGFGLSSGIEGLWPDGLVVYATHLVVLALVGTAVFLLKGIRPLGFLGYTVGSLVILLAVLGLIGLTSMGAIIGGNVALPTGTPTPTATSTPVPPTATPSQTPLPPTETPSPTVPSPTSSFTPSPTPSATLKPTPFYGEISVSEEFAGVYIRSEPSLDSQILTSLINGSLVEILDPAPEYDEQNRSWLRIRYEDAEGEGEGWVLENLISISTPVPNW